MTKKKPTSPKSNPKQSGYLPLLAAPIFLVVLLGSLFLAEATGLVKIDWQSLLSGKASDNVTPTAAAPVVITPVFVTVTPGPAPTQAAPVPPSGAWYQLYFTTPTYPDKPATRQETILQALLAIINSAQTSLDVAIYELNLDPIGDALLAARERGVNVRLVTDSDSLAEDKTLMRLQQATLPMVADNRQPIMHNKFVVVDDLAVWTGSWNFTSNDTFRNNNNAIYLWSPEIAHNYSDEFAEMFSQKFFGPTSLSRTANPRVQLGNSIVETCFAPEDKCADQLIVLLRRAQHSIRFMAFSFTQAGIGQAVIDRAKAGVIVQGVMETRGSETQASQLQRMKRQKLDVWADGNPYTLHHKVFIIDEQIVTLGSFNFTDNANQSNDENMLIIQNSDIAQQFLAEFQRVYTQAQNPPK
jgi:phosphatidylserine/phosphatidylglycerophosphate/cardiolipin synthase-like enzyme